MRNFKHNIKYFLILIIFLFRVQQSQALFGKYPIQNFTPSDYKAGIQNIDFAQNRDLTLFVANNLGLLSYNGNDWELHGFKSGKKVRSLAFDKNTNRLYVGSQGEFGYYKEDWNYVSLVEQIPVDGRDFDEVWDVFLFNSLVYFCTFQGIYVYDETQSISVIEHQDGLERSFHANGKLFTQSKSGRLFEIKDQELIPSYPQNQKGQIIVGIIPQDEGYLLFYNSGKIEFTTSFGVTTKYDDLIKSLEGRYVNHVLQLSDTRLAISTQTKGLFLYDIQKRSIENISTQDGLLTNACLRTFQDYAGNLWVGMQNGIALTDINSPIRFINQQANIQGSGYDVYEMDSGTYYTTSNGIYFLPKNATQSIFLKGTEGPAYGIQKITGKLYAGHHTGLFLLDKDQAKRVEKTNGLWQVKQLRSNPRYAIGGTYSGLYLFRINENKELQGVQKISGFNETSRFFEEDYQGRIWVGQFYKGLYQLNFKEGLTEVIAKKVSDVYKLNIDRHVLISRIDNELYFTTESGLYKLDQITDRIIEAQFFSEKIGKQQIYLLVQDNKKNIHVITEKFVGFFKQISVDNYGFVRSSLFHLRFFFNNDLLNVSVNSKSGVMFNANEGFIHYDPELENPIGTEKPLLVREVFSAAEDSILYGLQPFRQKPETPKKLVVSHKAKVLQFNVESFRFNEMTYHQFRYILKGFDEDFGEWTNSTTKEYSNLKAGDYEFIVQTRNNKGEIVSSLPFFLSVKPPFYKTLLARVIYVILVTCALFLLFKFQKQKFKQKAKEAEVAQQKELENKQRELFEIEEKKAHELQQLSEDKIKSELRHLNNLLAASTMNLVVKNEFIETIKEKLKDINRKGANRDTRKTLEQLVKEIDITLRLQEDWEQFEYHFDKVHGDFLTRFRNKYEELTPNEQKLCAFLRLNLNSKDISNLMGISIRGVEIARYRLRKKLSVKKGQNLSKFILEY